MKEAKILINNIFDQSHRNNFEMEINNYLKSGWQIISTHQHADNIDRAQVLLLTVVLQKSNVAMQ